MLYLHIGMSKAGSSAIQGAILRQEDRLSSLGIHVPNVGRLGREANCAHTRLAKSVRDSHRDPSLWEAARREIDAAEHSVISSEAFWLHTPEEIERTAVELGGRETTILLYVRDPKSYLVSSYLQAVKQKRSTRSIQEHVARSLSKLDYEKLICRWSEVGSLQAIRYESVRDGIERDFFDRIGAPDIPVVPHRVNQTPSLHALRALRTANHVLSHLPRRRWKPIRNWMIQHERVFQFLPELDVSLEGMDLPPWPPFEGKDLRLPRGGATRASGSSTTSVAAGWRSASFPH